MLDPLLNWSLDGPEAPKKPAAKPALRHGSAIFESGHKQEA